MNNRAASLSAVQVLLVLLLLVDCGTSSLMPEYLDEGSPFIELLFENRSSRYIDKSLLIKEYIDFPGNSLIITRPPGWGKSVNLDMLRRFFELEVDAGGNPIREYQKRNRLLFAGGQVTYRNRTKTLPPLKIAEYGGYMHQQGSHPVIYLDAQHIGGGNFSAVLQSLSRAVSDLYRRHRYVEKKQLKGQTAAKDFFKRCRNGSCDDATLAVCLQLLILRVSEYFEKPVHVFVDEFDAPFSSLLAAESSIGTDDFDKTGNLLRMFYGSALNRNRFIRKAVLTSVFPMLTVKIRNQLLDFDQYTLANARFSAFYGFDWNELGSSLSPADWRLSALLDSWYGGYNVTGRYRYRPKSISDWLNNEREYGPATDFGQSGNSDFIRCVLSREQYREKFLDTAIRRRVAVQYDLKLLSFERLVAGDIESFLFFAGYLFPVATAAKKVTELTVPNWEFHRNLIDRVLVRSKVAADAVLDVATAANLTSFEQLLRNTIADSPDVRDRSSFGRTLFSLTMHFTDRYHYVDSTVNSTDIVLAVNNAANLHHAIIFRYDDTSSDDVIAEKAKELLKEVSSAYRKATLGPSILDGSVKVLLIAIMFSPNDFAVQSQSTVFH